MISNFGKFCRKLRIDRGELLRDMATKLNVTASYLSAVENGKREIPDSWESFLSTNYSLNENERMDLSEAIFKSKKQIKIELENLNNFDKDLVLAFARKLDTLNTSEKDKILKILK